jgi:hypothetical protein
MTRKFERLLFHGVPEQPETIWERDDNTHVSMRKTGRAQTLSEEDDTEDFVPVGRFQYDFKSGKITYIPLTENLDKL